MTLHPHQHRALVAELKSEVFRNLTTDDAYALASSVGFLKQIGCVRFMTESEFESLPEKRKPRSVVLISDEESANFPTGVPGFPNKLRREWFDVAWVAANG